jgi:hypothetical protein
MLYSIVCEGALVILGIVEADDLRDLQVLKYAHIA